MARLTQGYVLDASSVTSFTRSVALFKAYSYAGTPVPVDVKTEVLDLRGHVLYSQSIKTTVGADRSQTVDVLNWETPNAWGISAASCCPMMK